MLVKQAQGSAGTLCLAGRQQIAAGGQRQDYGGSAEGGMLLSLLITQPSRCHHYGAHWGVLLAPAGLPVEVTQAPVSVSDPPALVMQQVTFLPSAAHTVLVCSCG